MTVRIVASKLLLMLAVLLMPLGMTPAASAQGPHDQAMAGMGHCDQQAPAHDSTHGFPQCTMACSAALPAFAASSEEPPPVVCLPPRPVTAQVLRGLPPETATPPPRYA